jgi:hypothetical protein
MDDSPAVSLHPDCGFEVDSGYDCPLVDESEFTLAAAQKSASKGCPCCILRSVAALQIWPNLPGSTGIYCGHGYIFLPFWVQSQRVVLAWTEVEKAQRSPSPEEAPVSCSWYGQQVSGIELVERFVPCDTASALSVENIRGWIEKCDEEHDCMSMKSVLDLPSRILDVRNNKIRLCESKTIDKPGRYACLSHRWGVPSESMFRTTEKNFTEHKDNIPWESLPRTFQDTVLITRRLGVNFLWIDSLCIIQENRHDFEQQSANMATIYQNAYITLAATASDGPKGGLYTHEHDVRSHRTGPPLAMVKYRDGSERVFSARRPFDHNLQARPLLSRGWVYQERVLSPRILHFVGEELVWECGASVDCECGAEDLENKFEHPRISNDDDEDHNSYVGHVSGHPYHLRAWMQLVTDYTALSLTNAIDIFPALSGIAKVYAAQTDDEYVAGLWRRTLVPNLLWYFVDEPVDVKAGAWRAPSWSWASVSTKSNIKFLPVAEELAEVRDTVCHLAGSDPTGRLNSAHLRLQTKGLPAVMQLQHGSIESNSTQYLCSLDNGFTTLRATDSSLTSLHLFRTGYFDLDDSRLRNNIESLDIMLVQMASVIRQSRVWLYDVYPHIPIVQEIRSYILLARQTNNSERWIRIGLAIIAEHGSDVALYGAHSNTMSEFEKQEVVKRMTVEEIEMKIEDHATHNRNIFQHFDNATIQDFVVY